MNDFVTLFRETAEQWVSNSYSASYSFISTKHSDKNVLRAARIIISPQVSNAENFRVDTKHVLAGFHVLSPVSRKTMVEITAALTDGQFEVNGEKFSLSANSSLTTTSELTDTNRWFCDGHIVIHGDTFGVPSVLESTRVDDELRACNMPFDGLADLFSFLGFVDSPTFSHSPYIEARIFPPADFILVSSKLENEKLALVLQADSSLDPKSIQLAIRAYKPDGKQDRAQIGGKIEWEEGEEKAIRNGKLETIFNNAHLVEVMLLVGGKTVRRQFFSDMSRSPNIRLSTLAKFDAGLKQLRDGLSPSKKPNNSNNFEKAVASIAYLCGLAPALMVEDDAPDLVASTPFGNIVLIECTTRLDDFRTKLSKLVNRRGALLKALQQVNPQIKIYSVLVCALPSAQIARDQRLLAQHEAILMTREDLLKAIDNAHLPQNPDAMLEDAIKALNRDSTEQASTPF